MVLSLSFKNIWRNRVRSLVLIMAMSVGLTGGIMAVAIMGGMVDQKVHATIHTEIAHLQVHTEGYLLNPELMAHLAHADSVVAYAQGLEGVEAAARRARVPVMISSARVSTGVSLVGVYPPAERRVSELHTAIADTSGTFFGGNRAHELVISQALADRLKVRLRSKVVITLADTAGNLTGAAFRVAGLFNTFNAPFDEGHAFIRATDFHTLTRLPQGASHEVAILLRDPERLQGVKHALQARFPGLQVRSWQEMQPEVALLSEWMAVMNYFIVGIILLTLGFGILNTMLMAVMDRVKEIGMLMAVGMSRGRVFAMIMLETILLSLMGGAGGTLVSLALLRLVGTRGFDFSAYSEGFDRMGYPSVIYPTISGEFFVGLAILVLLTGILSAVYPARKAVRMKPVEAIRTDT